jgi:beta-phosphoglucomutase-like phosphatase (HAD superfamily)
MVIFDCDGVLIDSEPLSRQVLAAEALTHGWRMTEAELHATTGLTWSALKPIIEGRLGNTLPPDWPKTMQDRIIPLLGSHAAAIQGARELLEQTSILGLPYRIASNSSHEEMEQKFAATGLTGLVQGRVHSARDVARGKPAPDLFLAASAASGIAPHACLVIEDSVPGIAAAHAAGMQVIAYAPNGASPDVSGASPHGVIRSLAELLPLFKAATLELAG